MRTWPLCLVVLSCLGCQTAFAPPRHPSSVATPAQEAQTAPADSAPRKPVSAAASKAAPEKEDRHLTLAAIYLDQGQEEKACLHLQFFLDAHPEHAGARYYRAELLQRMGKQTQAKSEFEATDALLQEEKLLDVRKLIHLHGRLTEMAEESEDDYERSLHRGIALYWLAQAPAGSAEEDQLLPAEGLLCKAAAALAEAHHLEPEAARPA